MLQNTRVYWLKSSYDDVISTVDDFLWIRCKQCNTDGRRVWTTMGTYRKINFIWSHSMKVYWSANKNFQPTLRGNIFKGYSKMYCFAVESNYFSLVFIYTNSSIKVFSKSIKTESVFTKSEINNEMFIFFKTVSLAFSTFFYW